jgi:hypothetical protein
MESKTLTKLVEQSREVMKDDAESVFFDKVLDGSTPELLFYLKTQARDRGYFETHRQEISGPDGSAIQINSVDISNGLATIAPRPISDSEESG